jgi:cellulose synthase/poly-beta-1,6-N-acetylglucosamine synthase-like glycosyltransferase
MRAIVEHALVALAFLSLGYFVAVNLTYLAFTALAWRGITYYRRARVYAGVDEAFASPLTPPISVLLPAFNEQAGIVESVRSLLALRYPEHEVIVVNDGSTDATLARLEEAFTLVPARKALRETVSCAPSEGPTPRGAMPTSGCSTSGTEARPTRSTAV